MTNIAVTTENLDEYDHEVKCYSCEKICFDGHNKGTFSTFFLASDGYLCEDCNRDFEKDVQEAIDRAPALAKEIISELRLTGTPPCFSPDTLWIDEYSKELNELRHRYTNYDELLKRLNDLNAPESEVYNAVRQAADELILAYYRNH